MLLWNHFSGSKIIYNGLKKINVIPAHTINLSDTIKGDTKCVNALCSNMTNVD